MKQRTMAALAAVATALAGAAMAQPGGPSGLPPPDVIARANTFKAPHLTDYAQKLASQPDMTGAWRPMDPSTAGPGPIFDPVNGYFPARLAPGEATFGPLPGTYIKGIPYNAEWKKKYEALIHETTEGKSRDTFAACFPFGTPRMQGATPVSFDIVQAPEIMDWNNNYGRSQRRIFLDGRPHPAPPPWSRPIRVTPSATGRATPWWSTPST